MAEEKELGTQNGPIISKEPDESAPKGNDFPGFITKSIDSSSSEPNQGNAFPGTEEGNVIEFWKTWNKRKKKGCKEFGECTCFEGVGSVF
mmetsp:Transcript_20717/g.24519  ORF Transcript_20717/g.24519 Transcript_20717/m.24519 type:complete len:90 (+) Transcript_20717:15-284(+)